MGVKAKMFVSSIQENATSPGSVLYGKVVKLQAVYGDSEENKTWAKWTPSGSMELQITNSDAYDQFKAGQIVIVTLEPQEDKQ